MAYEIATLSRDDLAIPLGWARAEGWNPGRDDAAAFYAADPDGFLVGRLDGVPVATISAVRYGASFGFVGLYIVAPEHRGQGLGIAIWRAALERLAGRTVGLDGVVAQQANYRRSGFVLAHRNIRYAGVASWSEPTPTRAVDLATLDADVVRRFDRRHFPEARDAFLAAWVRPAHGHALGIVDGGELVACGVVRACDVGYKIGPLNARSPALAEALFVALASRIPAGSALFLDVPEPNADALALARRHGMAPAFETARMYLGPAPDLPLGEIYGITTFELG